jgi:hypothetical protein
VFDRPEGIAGPQVPDGEQVELEFDRDADPAGTAERPQRFPIGGVAAFVVCGSAQVVVAVDLRSSRAEPPIRRARNLPLIALGGDL